MLRLLVISAVTVASAVGRGQDPPHVLFLLADDFGWANLGRHIREATGGADPLTHGVHTPTLDGLIDEGVLLDRHYAYRICSPSRSSLQTGRLAPHVNTKNTGVAAHNPEDPVSGYAGIPINMTGLGVKMRQAGYRTHLVGKWDAGMATPAHTPEGRGYDSFFGFFQHANDYWTHGTSLQSTGELDNCLNGGRVPFRDLFRTNSTYRGPVTTEELEALTEGTFRDDGASCGDDGAEAQRLCFKEELFRRESLAVIRAHDARRPLFLMHSFGLLHTPLQVPQGHVDRIDALVREAGGHFETRNQRLYAAMAFYMDEVVSDLVAALKQRGMWERTLVVFTSDNGGPVYQPGSANNFPLKGGKYADWEGGVRTNAFVSGGWLPEKARGRVHSGLVSIADWYATLPALGGVSAEDEASEKANQWLKARGLATLPPVDGVDQLQPMLTGTEGRPHGLVLSTKAALKRVGGSLYKLVTGVQPYSRHLSTAYPNCSIYCAPSPGYLQDGPDFVDFKCVDHPVPFREDPAEASRAKWEADCGEEGCLFNVDADPSEHVDLLAGQQGGSEQPQHHTTPAQRRHAASALADLRRMLAQALATEFAPDRGHLQLAACEAAVANGGVYGPFASVPDFAMDVDAWYSPREPLPMADSARYAALLAAAESIQANGASLVTALLRRVIPVLTQLCDPVSALSVMDVCLDRPDCNAEICVDPLSLGSACSDDVTVNLAQWVSGIVDEVSAVGDGTISAEAVVKLKELLSGAVGVDLDGIALECDAEDGPGIGDDGEAHHGHHHGRRHRSHAAAEASHQSAADADLAADELHHGHRHEHEHDRVRRHHHGGSRPRTAQHEP